MAKRKRKRRLSRPTSRAKPSAPKPAPETRRRQEEPTRQVSPDSHEKPAHILPEERRPLAAWLRRWYPELASALLYLLTRLPGLILQPLHVDETAHIYWAMIVSADWSKRFIAVWGGKQPLHSWIIAFFLKLSSDAVLAARLVSVVTGGLAALAIWLISRKLFTRRVALLAVVLYICMPYSLFFDRRGGMMDSLLTMVCVWTSYLCLELLEKPRWWAVVGLIVAVSSGLLTKSSYLIHLALVPAAILAFDPQTILDRLKRSGGAAVFIGCVSLLIYYLAFGSRQEAKQVSTFNTMYRFSTSELLTFPWDSWLSNGATILQWLIAYLTPPGFALVLVALLASLRLGRRAWMLALWGLGPILAHVILGKILYSRYILFALPSLYILVAYFLDWLYQRATRYRPLTVTGPAGLPMVTVVTATLAVLLLIWPLWKDWLLISGGALANPALIYTGDQIYFDLYGLRDMVDLLKRQATDSKPVFLLTNPGMDAVSNGSLALLSGESGQYVRVAQFRPDQGKLMVYDPVTFALYPKDVLQRGEVFYATYLRDEDVLAPYIHLRQEFLDTTGRPLFNLYDVDMEKLAPVLL